MELKHQLAVVRRIYAELRELAEQGDWAQAQECALRAQRMLTNGLLGHPGGLDPESAGLVRELLEENKRLLENASSRRDQLRQSGLALRRNRQAVCAYHRAAG